MEHTLTPATDTEDADLESFSAAVGSFLRTRADMARVRALRGTQPGYDRGLWREMAESGWLGVCVPERWGGLGLGWREAARVVAPCATALLPEPLVAGALLPARAVLHAGNERFCETLLPRIADGSLVAALAWQGPEGGLAVDGDTRTRAQADGGGIRLTGTKRFVVPAGADACLVVARRDDRTPGLYWVPGDAPGVCLVDEPRADGSTSCLVVLEDARVGAEALIASGDAVVRAVERALAEASVMACAEASAIMDRMLEITLEYLRTRVQFGKAIGSFQALQHRAADLHLLCQLSATAVRAAVHALDASDDHRACLLAASRAKSRCGDAVVRVAREAIQLHGAIGFSDESEIGLYLQRALVLSAWLGNGTEHRRRYATLADPEVPPGEGSDPTSQRPVRTRPFPTEGRRAPDPSTQRDWNALGDEDFRAEVRGYFEANYPQHLRYLLRRARWAETRDWYFEMSHKGWVAPHWPREHGGMGLSPAKMIVFLEEQERMGVARPPDIGLIMVGPILMRYGTDAQKREYLPRVLSGEHLWCQGYSEPNAGSDLAALQTTAVADGDGYVIRGQKIWTTLAHDATHMFLLARTDPQAARPQNGISCFILDVKTPGVTIRPIRNIEGHDEFCQVFLDDVRVPAGNLVGPLHGGWTVAKALLGFERLNHGSPRRAQYPLKRVELIARSRGLLEDPEFVGKYTRLRLDVADLADTYARFADAVRAGRAVGAEASMLKIWATETFQRLSELMIEAAGDAGAIRGDLDFGAERIDVLGPFYASFVATIAAGSNEIQRNILARRVLDLPK